MMTIDEVLVLTIPTNLFFFFNDFIAQNGLFDINYTCNALLGVMVKNF